MGSPDAPMGVLGAHTRTKRTFGETDIDFMQSVAHMLAAAIGRLRVEDQMRHDALHDALTGLPNRTLLLDRLRHALDRADRDGKRVALFFIDLDNLKVVNDSLGHHAGDELLCAMGPRLQGELRVADTVARFGGDEFAVVCEDVDDEAHALVIAERLVRAFEDPFIVGGEERFGSVSVGVVVTDPDAPRGAEELLSRRRRRDVPRQGARPRPLRGVRRRPARPHHRPAAGGERPPPRARGRRAPVGRLPALLPPAQPQGRGRRGARALGAPGARQHPAVGLHPDGRGERPRDPARRPRPSRRVRAGRALAARDPAHGPSAHRQRLRPPDGHARLRRGRPGDLATTGLHPDSLGLEITEGLLLEETPGTALTIELLQALGVRLLLDDFGTGFSSLRYLQRYPLDGLKVDRAFVTGLGEDGEGDGAIVEAIVGMARALGMAVIPEGVETEGQLERLIAIGCDHAQGFLLSRPLPAAGARGAPAERRVTDVALSEVLGGLSYALDITEGEPPGHAVRTTAIGMRLAEQIGLGEEERSALFYALLLKDAGCSSNASRLSSLFAADDQRPSAR